MSGFLEAASKVAKFSLRWDDDFYDRLSHRYTVIILVIFTIVSVNFQLTTTSSKEAPLHHTASSSEAPPHVIDLVKWLSHVVRTRRGHTLRSQDFLGLSLFLPPVISGCGRTIEVSLVWLCPITSCHLNFYDRCTHPVLYMYVHACCWDISFRMPGFVSPRLRIQ